jgi:hypothetical protein
MSKTINNVKLSADFKIASTRQQLWDSTATDQTKNQSVNVSNALGIIAKWLADFGTAAFNNTGDFATSGHVHDLNSDSIIGTLPVSKGGTGKNTLASGQVLIGNGTSAVGTREIASSVSSTSSTKLVTEGAVASAGYVKSSGVTSITPGDGIVNGSGTTAAITSTGTLKAALANYTKATIAADTGSTATAGRYYPVALDKNGKMAVAVPWTTPVTSVAGRTGAVTLSTSDISGLGTAATANTESTLSNGSNLPTGAAITTYVASQIGALGNILTFKGVVATVSALPTTGNKVGDVYFVGTNTTTGKDDFTEYVWAEVSSGVYEWEYLGKVQVDPDLSAYLTAVGFSNTSTNDAVKLKITQTKNNGSAATVAEITLPTATTARYGVTKLSSATDSTSEVLAATPKAVKSAYDRAVVYNGTVDSTGSGNAITALTISDGQVHVTKGSTFLTAHPTIPTTDDTTTSPAQLAHAGTFTAITGVTRDANGHVTTLNTATYKLPASSNTDTKVTSTTLALTTAAASYQPTFVAAAGTGDVKIMTTFKFGHTPGTTSAVGQARLELGNATASGTAQNEEGQLVLYSSSTKKAIVKSAALSSADVTHTLPATTGTILNTGTTSYTQTVASTATGAYQIGTIKINGTDTILYGKDTNTTYGGDRGISLVSGKFGHSNTATAVNDNSFLKIAYDGYGHIKSSAAVQKKDLSDLGAVCDGDTDVIINCVPDSD